MSTRKELRELVKPNLGGRTDKDTVINSALEAGLKYAINIHFFRSMINENDVEIVADDTYLTIPSTYFQLLECRLIDGTASYNIDIRPKKWITERWPNISERSTAKPIYGYIEGGKIYLYPVSNGSYTVRITTCDNPTFSSADATENPIPCLDDALVYYATAHVMKSLQMFELAASWDLEFARAFSAAKTGDMKGPEVYRLEPFGAEKPAVIEPYLDPFAGH